MATTPHTPQAPAKAEEKKRFTFIGDKHGLGPDTITLFGLEFPKGKPIEVTDKAAIAKLEGNSHFKAA